MADITTEPLLSVRNLSVCFPTEEGPAAYAVNHLSFDLAPGRVLGLVGESGCGKSLTSLAILRLVPAPGEITSGEILFEGKNLLTLSENAIRQVRGAHIALIPQDPLTSLNPVYTVGDQITEVLELHQKLDARQSRQRAIELLDLVRIPNAKERINDYPHQFSGGMRQRVMIAMALSCTPKLLIADEPTTALDVTVQAQILDLLRDIQKSHGTAILMITHDLGVVAEMCDDVAVMYAGSLVEEADVRDLFAAPRHPYTQGLLHSLPTIDGAGNRTRLIPIEGQPPSITEVPPGCPFTPRCPQRMDICSTAFPARTRTDTANGPHHVCCYLYEGSVASTRIMTTSP